MGTIGDGTGSDFGTGVLDTVGLVSPGGDITTANNNDLQQIAVQIQTVLGALVYGTFGSVQDRLNNIENRLAALEAILIRNVQVDSPADVIVTETETFLASVSVPTQASTGIVILWASVTNRLTTNEQMTFRIRQDSITGAELGLARSGGIPTTNLFLTTAFVTTFVPTLTETKTFVLSAIMDVNDSNSLSDEIRLVALYI